MKKIIFFAALTLLSLASVVAQNRPNVLFIGNSYTEVNNLPLLVQHVAQSMGDDINYSSNTPGGCTFQQHCSNQSMDLIRHGGWDYVILQEQSQYPSFPQAQVENEVFPFAAQLVDSVYANNPCAEPMFYMTWGRKNGDQGNAPYFPVLGTYEGMDSMLAVRYTYMANANDASLCPVGRVWHYLRENHQEIELYQGDESHPSMAGSYAAACAFYVMIFHRNPVDITYNPGLSADEARIIRDAVRIVVYDQQTLYTRPLPMAAFAVSQQQGLIVTFSNQAMLNTTSTWHFGDGESLVTSDSEVRHTYPYEGSWTVMQVAERHCMTDTMTLQINVLTTGNEGILTAGDMEVNVYPNPVVDKLTVRLAQATGNAVVSMVDVNGRLVRRMVTIAGVVEMDMNDLPAGYYQLTVQHDGDWCVRKVVKK